jgi:hypothetical protein
VLLYFNHINNIQIKDGPTVVRLANLTSYHSFGLNCFVKLFTDKAIFQRDMQITKEVE